MKTITLEDGRRGCVDEVLVPLDKEKIKALREKLGLTFDQAAKKGGLSGGAGDWWRIEAGKRKNLTLETLDRIAHALGVQAKDLLK